MKMIYKLKGLFSIFIISGFLIGCAGSNWTQKDLSLEVAYGICHIADWHQTKSIDYDAGQTERNPILGEQPSDKAVDSYFLSTGLLHIFVADRLPPRWRNVFQVVTIGIQGFTVTVNAEKLQK